MAKEKNKLKTIDAPVYSYWSALFMCFYSHRIYVDIGKRWKGIGLLYLLLAIAILTIPFSLRMSSDFNKSFNEQLIEPLKQLPTIYVQNGNVTFDRPMPYLIKNDKDQVVIIIDTTGQITEFKESYPNLNILINKDIIYFRMPTPQIMGMTAEPVKKGVVISQPLEKGANLVFDGKKIVQNNAISGLKYASQLIIYPIVVAIFYSMLVVIFLVMAFLGQVFSSVFFSFSLKFKASCRLFIVSATPMLAVLLLFLSLNLIFPGFGFILMALLIGYYSYAIYSLRTESMQLVHK